MGRENMHTDLRIPSVERGRKIEITVDGQSVAAYEGETVHAAMTAAGIRPMRSGLGADQLRPDMQKTAQKRGIFCGMGICYECLVTINGIPDQRACMTAVADRMEVTTCEG